MFKQMLLILFVTLLNASAVQANNTTLCSQQHQAACPVELIAPPLEPIECGSTQMLTYTLVNNTPATIQINYIKIVEIANEDTSPNSSVTHTGGSCGTTLAANKSCTVIVTIDAAPCTSPCLGQVDPKDFVQEQIAQQLQIGLSGNPSIVSSDIIVQVTAPSFTGILVAAGQTSTGMPAQETPFFVAYDEADTWNAYDFYHASASGDFADSSCTGSGTSAVCSLVGTYQDNVIPPVVQTSQNGGVDWIHPTFTANAPTNTSTLTGTSCSGNGSNAVCSIVGYDPTLGGLFYLSTNGGLTFSQSFSSINTVTIYATACTGDASLGGSYTCIGVGSDPNDNAWVGIQTNTNMFLPVPGFPANSHFTDATCTTANGFVVCAVVGVTNAGNAMLWVNPDVVNMPGPAGWTDVSPPSQPTSLLNAVSCTTQNNQQAICAAVGSQCTGMNCTFPLVLISPPTLTVQWPFVLKLTSTGTLNDVACTIDSMSHWACTAVGSFTDNTPLLVTNNNGVWEEVNFTGFTSGTLNSAACSPNGSNVLCSIVGNNSSNSPEFFINTNLLNNTSTWFVPAGNPLPANGTLSTTAVANGG